MNRLGPLPSQYQTSFLLPPTTVITNAVNKITKDGNSKSSNKQDNFKPNKQDDDQQEQKTKTLQLKATRQEQQHVETTPSRGVKASATGSSNCNTTHKNTNEREDHFEVHEEKKQQKESQQKNQKNQRSDPSCKDPSSMVNPSTEVKKDDTVEERFIQIHREKDCYDDSTLFPKSKVKSSYKMKEMSIHIKGTICSSTIQKKMTRIFSTLFVLLFICRLSFLLLPQTTMEKAIIIGNDNSSTNAVPQEQESDKVVPKSKTEHRVSLLLQNPNANNIIEKVVAVNSTKTIMVMDQQTSHSGSPPKKKTKNHLLGKIFGRFGRSLSKLLGGRRRRRQQQQQQNQSKSTNRENFTLKQRNGKKGHESVLVNFP